MDTDLRRVRESLGLAQIQMAVRADVSLGTICGLEAGRLNPTARTRRKLAAAYGVEIEQINAACQPAADPQLAA